MFLLCWFPGVYFACTAGDERVMVICLVDHNIVNTNNTNNTSVFNTLILLKQKLVKVEHVQKYN